MIVGNVFWSLRSTSPIQLVNKTTAISLLYNYRVAHLLPPTLPLLLILLQMKVRNHPNDKHNYSLFVNQQSTLNPDANPFVLNAHIGFHNLHQLNFSAGSHITDLCSSFTRFRNSVPKQRTTHYDGDSQIWLTCFGHFKCTIGQSPMFNNENMIHLQSLLKGTTYALVSGYHCNSDSLR